MHIQKSNNYQHAGCRLYPCNILNSSHLNHFWVQPEIFKVLPRVLGVTSVVVLIFNIKCSQSASYRGTTYNQHLSVN